MRRSILALALVTSLGGQAGPARAEAPPPSSPALDFDLFGEQAKPADPQQEAARARQQAALDDKVRRRRKILKAHQALGFTTLALLAATLVVGQLNWYHKLGPGDFTEAYNTPHAALAGVTSAAFAATGILALAAPNPYPKPIKADAALLHKISMGLATAGMVTQLILGPIAQARAGTSLEGRLAIGHLATGYLTFACMAVGVFAYVF